MVEKVIFDTHSHQMEDCDDEDLEEKENSDPKDNKEQNTNQEINMINVNNNYNIKISEDNNNFNKLRKNRKFPSIIYKEASTSSLVKIPNNTSYKKSLLISSNKINNSKNGSMSICNLLSLII
jgi:hypothetical protein